jgi:signal transduction histidine kinase
VQQSAALNRLSLCFLDPEIERDFRLQRAEASRPILRRFIVFMVVLVAFVTTGIRHKLELARAAGLPVPPQLDAGGAELTVAALLAAVLFAATLSRRFVPYLHTLTALCMAGLVLVDAWHSRQIPYTYALYGTLLNLVVLYVASQLRFVVASLLGISSTLAYLCCMAARSAPALQDDPELQLKMGVTVTLLGCANLLLMFVSHQRELLARLAYDRARLLEQRGAELESALASLKQAELQLVENEKQATVGRLVAGILHEMNTPLGALSSATQTLSRGLARLTAAREEKPEEKAKLEALERLTSVQAASGERIREVVQGLEQFVALDQAALQVTDVRSGLETAVSFIRPSLPRAVRVSLDLPRTPIWVKCFPARLNHVFLNLLKNAAASLGEAESGGSGQPRELAVRAEVLSDRLRIEVRDNGCGIAPERLERIFELDFSRQGSRVKLCLGLPASRGVVEAIGGSLSLRSSVGRGTVATIELPLGPSPASAGASPLPVETPPRHAPTPPPAPAAVRVRPIPSA